MAMKKQKKNKKNLIKLKQKEIRSRNKTSIEEVNMCLEENSIYFNEISEFDGVKSYVLVTLLRVINNFKQDKHDDELIKYTAAKLALLCQNPFFEYNKLLHKEFPKQKLKNNSKKNENSLNTTERAVLKSAMQCIIADYMFTHYEEIDYGAIKICFEYPYMLICQGLDEKVLKSIDLDIGYGDVLIDVRIKYEDNFKKYNLDEEVSIIPNWNSLDDLYNSYEEYRHIFLKFSESSLQSLSTADVAFKEYTSRVKGRELLSYNGIAMNYVGVLETEIKKLITKEFNISNKKLRLIDAINHLEKLKDVILSSEVTINKLHEVRILRNKIAHGGSISYEEVKFIQDTLLTEDKILQWISYCL